METVIKLKSFYHVINTELDININEYYFNDNAMDIFQSQFTRFDKQNKPGYISKVIASTNLDLKLPLISNNDLDNFVGKVIEIEFIQKCDLTKTRYDWKTGDTFAIPYTIANVKLSSKETNSIGVIGVPDELRFKNVITSNNEPTINSIEDCIHTIKAVAGDIFTNERVMNSDDYTLFQNIAYYLEFNHTNQYK